MKKSMYRQVSIPASKVSKLLQLVELRNGLAAILAEYRREKREGLIDGAIARLTYVDHALALEMDNAGYRNEPSK